MSSTVVAIDGPAGAGKSSVAKALAARMNFVHINTGSLYRAIAYALLQMNVAPENITPEDLEHISRLYLIVDSRHKPTQLDKDMVTWVRSFGVPMTVVANKVDKLKKKELEENIPMIWNELGLIEGEDHIIPFSADKGTNRLELIRDIENALGE